MYSFRCIPYDVFMDYEVAWQIMYDNLTMIWILEWPALHYNLGLLCRNIIIQVNYIYTCLYLCESLMNDCRSIYGRLITDVTR